MNYHTSTTIHLSLESFHNAGMTPEQTKEVITSIYDGSSKLWCRQSGINSNWDATTFISDLEIISDLVFLIENKLCDFMTKKGMKLPWPYDNYGSRITNFD
jgi:hypothetical protein